MSTNNEKEKLEEKVLVNENEEVTEIAVQEEVEPKSSKIKKIGKTVLKVAGVAGVGVLGFILGARSSNRNSETEEPEVIEAEVIDE